jgi:peptidoglycan/LPS O-acetylase OafA/YrhL
VPLAAIIIRLVDPFGIRAWRAKPLRERMMPWPVYLLLALVMLAISLYLFTEPEGLSNTGPVGVITLVVALVDACVAVVARRVRGDP